MKAKSKKAASQKSRGTPYTIVLPHGMRMTVYLKSPNRTEFDIKFAGGGVVNFYYSGEECGDGVVTPNKHMMKDDRSPTGYDCFVPKKQVELKTAAAKRTARQTGAFVEVDSSPPCP